jgi:threonine/homoserine/homoserine lactone efflux protein
MWGIENFGAFVIASAVLVMSPGNDTIMVLTRSITHGQKIGVYSALGVTVAFVVHTLAATLGLSLILSRSAMAFDIVKYLGAVYLFYLGYQALTSKSTAFKVEAGEKKTANSFRMFGYALLGGILNPKTAIFFLAFFPQFISTSEAQNPLPYILLGTVISLITVVWCVFLALMGSSVSAFLKKYTHAEKWINRTSGLIFIALGLKVAFLKK